MKRTQTTLVAVGLLALVGGGTALAAKGKTATNSKQNVPAAVRGGHDGPSDELDAAASYLGTTTAGLMTQLQAGKTLAQIAAATSGKSVSGLVAALVAAEKTEIAAAVTAGKLTQAQADQITASLTQRLTDFVNGTRPAGGPPGGPGFGHGPGGGDLAAAATYLGTTTANLMTQLQSGKTLAQIASATSGKSTAGLVSALVAAEKTEIAAAVTAGRLTQAQADQITATLTQRFTDLVNGTRPAGGPPGGFGHPGDHHPDGPSA
jgi:urease accessory protein UreF